jgi:hypothetical protein
VAFDIATCNIKNRSYRHGRVKLSRYSESRPWPQITDELYLLGGCVNLVPYLDFNKGVADSFAIDGNGARQN